MTRNEKPYVLLGRVQEDHLRIEVLGRQHPDSDDYGDGNWLVTSIDLIAGGFRAGIGAGLRANELREFRLALTAVQDSLAGEALLSSLEDWLSLRVTVDARGHVAVNGNLRDHSGGGNALAFEIMGGDQSDLASVLTGLDNIEARFPVVGAP